MQHKPNFVIETTWRARAAAKAAPTPLRQHGRALLRGVGFVLAAIWLILPLAIAARHSEAELTLTRPFPLDLSAAGAPRALLPLLRGADL